MLFRYSLQYSVRKIQVNQYGLKLNVTHQLLIYVDVNILGGSVYTVKKNTESLVVVSEETELELNVGNLSTWSCLEIRMQDKVTIWRSIIVLLNWWNSPDIWEQSWRIKILFAKKISAYISQCRILCLWGCHPKIYRKL